MTLYTYFRSSAAYRVRIALNLKGLAFEPVAVHLLRGGGEQHTAAYRQINPSELVPTLVDQEVRIGQSLAIMEYLEERYPTPALLPATAAERARVRALAQTIACDVHPLNNLRVLRYLEHDLHVDEAAKASWYRHWITLGFDAFEALLTSSPHTGVFCHGDTPGLADCCLIPQLANARRFDTPLEAFPTLLRIETACLALAAFQRAAPQAQADAHAA
ncbi:MAG: maleylacetoacetate isomerase [Rhodoferax sp.]